MPRPLGSELDRDDEPFPRRWYHHPGCIGMAIFMLLAWLLVWLWMLVL